MRRRLVALALVATTASCLGSSAGGFPWRRENAVAVGAMTLLVSAFVLAVHEPWPPCPSESLWANDGCAKVDGVLVASVGGLIVGSSLVGNGGFDIWRAAHPLPKSITPQSRPHPSPPRPAATSAGRRLQRILRQQVAADLCGQALVTLARLRVLDAGAADRAVADPTIHACAIERGGGEPEP